MSGPAGHRHGETPLAAVVRAAPVALRDHGVPDPGPGRFPALAARSPERAFVLEALHEGYLAHYREPTAFAGMDPDLSLLAGDALYALGLSRLAERGDLEAVLELADLISASARAELEGASADVHGLWRESARRLAK